MAKKTYKTHSLKGLQILLFDDSGRPIEVNFRSGAQIDSTAKFTTSDEKVQGLLEKCNSYGRDFYIESVREENGKRTHAPVASDTPSNLEGEKTENATEEKEPENEGNVVKVADRSEAIEWLKENYPDRGYTKTNLKGKAFDEACSDCNVTFKFTA